MSIRALYGVPERAGIRKVADGLTDSLKAIGAYVDWQQAKLLALATGTGWGLGWLGAQLTAKGRQDIDAARAAYHNERAQADIGKLRTKLQQEYAAKKQREAEDVKPMRLL